MPTYNVYDVSIDDVFEVKVNSAGPTSTTVTDPSTSPVLTLGDGFTDSGENGEIYYVGVADNSSGTAVGFVGYDPTTKQTYLFTEGTSTPGSTYFMNYSLGPLDPFKGNFNLITGQAQSGDAPHCFMAGTSVTTPAGEVAVETLRIGDIVTLHNGAAAPVSWVGRQTVSTVFADKLRVLPVRIKAGALGESMPSRDLLISPDHAILLDGVLVQAGALVNGVSIVRESAVPTTFVYYHVEVADHSLILAEGVPAETFVDNVDRLAFDNWAEHEALYGTEKAVPEMDYPRAKAQRQVPMAIRSRLLARGQELYGVEVALAS